MDAQHWHIYSLRLGSNNIVIFNSVRIMNDLMDLEFPFEMVPDYERWIICSPGFYLCGASEIIHNGNSVLMQPYADRWVHHKWSLQIIAIKPKYIRSLLGIQALNLFCSYQNCESLQMLNDLLSIPKDITSFLNDIRQVWLRPRAQSPSHRGDFPYSQNNWTSVSTREFPSKYISCSWLSSRCIISLAQMSSKDRSKVSNILIKWLLTRDKEFVVITDILFLHCVEITLAKFY